MESTDKSIRNSAQKVSFVMLNVLLILVSGRQHHDRGKWAMSVG